MLMYGSILMEVTSMPQQFNNVPNELAMTPFPTPLITPPVTRMYFMVSVLLAANRTKRLHIELKRWWNRKKCKWRTSTVTRKKKNAQKQNGKNSFRYCFDRRCQQFAHSVRLRPTSSHNEQNEWTSVYCIFFFVLAFWAQSILKKIIMRNWERRARHKRIAWSAETKLNCVCECDTTWTAQQPH